MPDPWRRVQTWSFGVGVSGLFLGLFASLDLRLVPAWPRPWLPAVHLLAGVTAGLAGWAAQRRLVTIDRERWHWATEAGSSFEERKLAHAEAERRRRAAGLAFCLGPVGLAYWLANQAAESGAGPALVTLTAFVALGLGFLAARLIRGPSAPPP